VSRGPAPSHHRRVSLAVFIAEPILSLIPQIRQAGAVSFDCSARHPEAHCCLSQASQAYCKTPRLACVPNSCGVVQGRSTYVMDSVVQLVCKTLQGVEARLWSATPRHRKSSRPPARPPPVSYGEEPKNHLHYANSKCRAVYIFASDPPPDAMAMTARGGLRTAAASGFSTSSAPT
jgi:hypothetical protein